MMPPESPVVAKDTMEEIDSDRNSKEKHNKTVSKQKTQNGGAAGASTDGSSQPGVHFSNFTEERILSDDEDEGRTDDGSPEYQSIDLSTHSWDIKLGQARRKEKHVDESKTAMVILKFAKVIAFIVTFILILGEAIFSKAVLLLMTSQIKPNRTMHLDIAGFGENRHYKVMAPTIERMGWYWGVFFVLLLPELLILLQTIYVLLFKTHKKPSGGAFFAVFLMETLHTIGVSLLVLHVFPKLDVVRAIMLTNCCCAIPILLTLLSRRPDEKLYRIKLAADVCCFVIQVGGLVVWCFQNDRDWTIVVAGICVSCGWWENFVNTRSELIIVERLQSIRTEMKTNNTRYFTYFFLSIWKIVLYLSIMLILLALEVDRPYEILTKFESCFESYRVVISQIWMHSGSSFNTLNPEPLMSDGMLPVYLSSIQMATSLFAYLFAMFACKICIQEFSFALPATLTVPVAVFVLSSGCLVRSPELNFLTDYLPKYVFWTCPAENSVFEFLWQSRGLVWILMFFSQIWATTHIWVSSFIPLISADKLFVNPMYNGALIDQSLVFNRRRHQFSERAKQKVSHKKNTKGNAQFEELYEDLQGVRLQATKRNKRTIYACATMWHENKEEMLQILKSIMRMDTYLTEKTLLSDPKANSGADYEFKTHIFFDDAFHYDKTKKSMMCNSYVKDLIAVMGNAASFIYPSSIRSLGPPMKYITPYGGRLVWKLPGKTKITVHLKDNNKIRHKKRWSQVMYMYYLLGYKLATCSNEKQSDLEENSFVLALDGDIDFKPQAVTRLVELMEDEDLGAACGRIHPVGNGLIVWYQKFEYAVGHWLQKATEHVIGCVLCSPGCFSLFRGKALMKVMRTYASKAERALEYVQYDQGEDRWLCTLILKQGYRIQYSAASDAYTHCPETFGEFYTQRRRWGPSTMANVMDILMDFKHTVKVNNNISMLYITYQFMIMVGTILGPGTIFLMVVGAMVAALPISNATALLCNLVPVSLFVISCFFTTNDFQILFAQILSALYALLMMAVLVGTVIQLQEDGINSPSGIFLIALASSFIIAGIVHPYEFFCLIHGFLYFMCVPAMYLLLTVYSLINLNIVSWGTREDPVEKAEGPRENIKVDMKNSKKASGPIESFTKFFSLQNMTRLCNCSLCTYEKETGEETEKLLGIAENLEEVRKEMTFLRKDLALSNVASAPVPDKDPVEDNEGSSVEPEETVPKLTESAQPSSTTEEQTTAIESTEDRPLWVTDEGLRKGKTCRLQQREHDFFCDLIKKYLLPLDSSEEAKTRAESELINLRNNVVFGFLMFNSMFILIVFLLQVNKDSLFINWPLGGIYNITFIPAQNKVLVEKDPMKLDPIGLVFAVFFGMIIAVQFVAMIIHRFETFAQILASTTIDCRFDMIEEFEVAADILDDDDDEEAGDEKELLPSEVVVVKHSTPVDSRRKLNRRQSLFQRSEQNKRSVKIAGLEEVVKRQLQKKNEAADRGKLDRRQSKYIRRMSAVIDYKRRMSRVSDRDENWQLRTVNFPNEGHTNEAYIRDAADA